MNMNIYTKFLYNEDKGKGERIYTMRLLWVVYDTNIGVELFVGAR